MLLSRAVELFVNEYKGETRTTYKHVMEDMRDFVGPARSVAEIKPEHLLEYAQAVKSRKYADATVRKYLKSCRTFFNWLIKIDVIDKSPARAVKIPQLRKYVSRDKAMTDAELEKLLAYVRWKPRDFALILFIADTGCRAGGAAGLKVADLDLPNCRAVVLEKGDKSRPVVFGVECANAIREWLLKRPASAGIYVFSRTSKAIKSDNVSLIIRRACKKVGIRTLSAHSLRHRKGHQLADHKVAPSIAATALGHSDVTITLQHYYPADWETAEREMRKLVHHDENEEKIIRLEPAR